jgi:hypothetical protein
MKALVETAYALSLPGVMGHLYGLPSRKKSFHAKTQRREGTVFFFATWRLCEKKIISRKAGEARRGDVVIT